MNIHKNEGETEMQYLWRLGTAKSNGLIDLTWTDIADLINKEFCHTENPFGESKYRKTYHFYPSEVNVIMIGRDEKNIICVNEKLVSKWHCNIYYEALEKKWFIIDGYLNKNSTNGTWKFCNEKVQLINQTDYIKIGKSIIEINKVN